MALRDEVERLLALLGHVRKGSMRVRIGPSTVVDLDSSGRTVRIDLGLVDGTGKGKVAILHERRIGFWQAWGFARSLDASGWQLILAKDGHELVWMGRGVSALTGHIRADLLGLLRAGELRRML